MKLHQRLPQPLLVALKERYEVKHRSTRLRRAERHLVDEALRLSAESLVDVNTLEEWQAKRPEYSRHLAWMLGLEPFPERTDLHAEITGALDRQAYRIEKIVFQSLPGLWVTANFYVPCETNKPLPCVVYLNGHWPSLDGAKTGFQARYLWYPANGFALLVLDPLGFGEIPGVHPGMNRLNRWDWLSLGYTPAGVEVWNAMRALDWLGTRPEVDYSRIGVTGISGGGVMAQFLAALDERVAVAAASCSTYTIGTQAAMGLVSEQCDCTYYANVFRMDFPEVLALVAPRPLLILGGRKDPIFPPAGFREAFRRARRIYDLFDKPGRSETRIRLVQSGQGHADPPHFLLETHRWMCRWLREQDAIDPTLEAADPRPEQPEALRCTAGVPQSALNYRIHDAWIERPALNAPATREDWARRKEELLDVLRIRVFGWFPQAETPFETRRLVGSGGYAGDFADFGEYEFDSEPGVPVRVRVFTPWKQIGRVPLVVWVKGPSDHVAFPDLDEFHSLLRSHTLAIVTPRFAERSLPGHDLARIERTAVLVGRSVASMQVWDVLRTVAWVSRDRGIEPSEITVYGRGRTGITGLYAALLDSTVGHVVLRDAPLSHVDGPAVPTILRDTDIEEVAGVLAPRRLTLLSHRADGFVLTRSIFDLIDADAAFGYAPSLAEALLGRAAVGEALSARGGQSC